MALGVDEMLKFQNYYYIIIILLLFLLLPDNAAAEMKQDRAIVLVAIIVRKIIECFLIHVYLRNSARAGWRSGCVTCLPPPGVRVLSTKVCK